jgi:hypothetical protein
MTSTIIPTKDVAALLRKELRTTFPGVRFSVRCSPRGRPHQCPSR